MKVFQVSAIPVTLCLLALAAQTSRADDVSVPATSLNTVKGGIPITVDARSDEWVKRTKWRCDRAIVRTDDPQHTHWSIVRNIPCAETPTSVGDLPPVYRYVYFNRYINPLAPSSALVAQRLDSLNPAQNRCFASQAEAVSELIGSPMVLKLMKDELKINSIELKLEDNSTNANDDLLRDHDVRLEKGVMTLNVALDSKGQCHFKNPAALLDQFALWKMRPFIDVGQVAIPAIARDARDPKPVATTVARVMPTPLPGAAPVK
jgi:hypothetical protein